MAVRPLVIVPDAQLRLISNPVAEADRELRLLVDDMFATMYDAPGIGLAAIQIGVPRRVITIDLARKEEAAQPLVLINPEIVWSSEERREMEEGCLSIPEYYETVERPDRIRVQYQDADLKPKILEADGLLATCIQHEVDHLNGVLFIDYLSKLKRDRVLRKFAKQAKLKEPEA
ncbi:peptide deformylase [Rhabdaerophilum sp. SD176]|uniref:peptide deformylase n=1 Tax=Rhabdaerophilum sp. SD176 TaxID=2983548 RepID=UPI0024E03135|nr:peptide deformylase [Rhabdaerophilum sp. SD176]